MKHGRSHDLDVLRGFLLVLMTLSHLPTRLSAYTQDIFGFVSGAEGFVFLSATLVALKYTTGKLEPGAVRNAIWRRSARLYACHGLLLALAFVAATQFASRPSLHSALQFMFDAPRRAALGAALLVYCPSLLDILPLYILFMLATPFALQLAAARGSLAMLGVSGALWLGAQFGLRTPLQHAVSALLGPVPADDFGSFDVLGWQFLWALGLAFGREASARAALARAFAGRRIHIASAVCALFLALHYAGDFGFALPAPALFDKWTLAPLRLVDLTCLTALLLRYGPKLTQWAGNQQLALLGRASLPVFCGHVALCYFGESLIDDPARGLAHWQEPLLISGAVVALFLMAMASDLRRSSGGLEYFARRQ